MAVSDFDKNNLSAQNQANIDALSKQYMQIQENAMANGGVTAEIQAQLDQIHGSAEALRAQAGYSGGIDGSQGIFFNNGQPTTTPIVSATPQYDYVEALQKAQQEAALQALKSAYDQNVIDMDAQAAKLPATYQAARNQTAATAEQNRAGFNERAAAYGLNSGAGGQADLAMRNQNNANMTAINQQEATAVNDLDTMRLKVSTQYQNDIAQAIADGNMQKAQLLYQEAVRVDESLVAQSMAQADENYRYWTAQQDAKNNAYAIQKAQADNMAAYGDFSGYLEMGYPQETVDWMYRVWAAQNPLLAQAAKGTTGSFNYGSGGGNYLPEDDKPEGDRVGGIAGALAGAGALASGGSSAGGFGDPVRYDDDKAPTHVTVRQGATTKLVPIDEVKYMMNQGVVKEQSIGGKTVYVDRRYS